MNSKIVNKEEVSLFPKESKFIEFNSRNPSSETTKNLLLKISNVIAKDGIGVIENQQKGIFIVPSGVNSYIPPKREPNSRFSLLELSWWFVNNPLSNDQIIYKLIEYFEKKLPEALPKRYGESEPPQYKFSEEGMDHLKTYVTDHLYDGLVFYPTKPVVNVRFSLKKDWGFYYGRNNKFFGANHLAIGFDSSVLDQPGWKELLQKVFKDISIILQPYYGDVRMLHNYIYRGPTCFSDIKSEQHPIAGSRWMGIPKNLGKAIIIGEPYLQYLPKLKQKGKFIGSLCYLSVDDWSSKQTVNDIIGNLPTEIAQVKPYKLFLSIDEALNRSNDEFPIIFPFYKEAKK